MTIKCDLDLKQGKSNPNEIEIDWDVEDDLLSIDIYSNTGESEIVSMTVCLNAEHSEQLGRKLIELSKSMKGPRP